MARNIEVFEISSKKDIIYKELIGQYETNSEVQKLLDEPIIPPGMIWAGDFSLFNMLKQAINMNGIKVYLIKDVDNNIFLWVIGRFDNGKIIMYPLLNKQSKKLQLEIRKVLIEKGLIKNLIRNISTGEYNGKK